MFDIGKLLKGILRAGFYFAGASAFSLCFALYYFQRELIYVPRYPAGSREQVCHLAPALAVNNQLIMIDLGSKAIRIRLAL